MQTSMNWEITDRCFAVGYLHRCLPGWLIAGFISTKSLVELGENFKSKLK